MIHKLDPQEFEKARPLFSPMAYNLAPIAILDRAIPGNVFVDNVSRPKTAVTWNHQRIYLAGNTQNAGFNRQLGKLFSDRIAPQAVAVGRKEFVLYYTPDEWENAVETVFEGKWPTKD